MINPFKEINWKPKPVDLRKFAWSLIIGLPCIAVLFFLAKWIKIHAVPDLGFFLLLGGMGVAVGLVSLLVPFMARPLYFFWFGLAACIGIVIANLIFILTFYLVFTPIGLLMRMTARDPLNLKWKKNAKTHWIETPPAPPVSHYFRQY